jgi:hypothetical protein
MSEDKKVDAGLDMDEVTLSRRDLMEVGKLTGRTASDMMDHSGDWDVMFAMQFVAMRRAGLLEDGVSFEQFLDMDMEMDSGN